MKIKVLDSKGVDCSHLESSLIESVHMEETEIGSELIINTKDRWLNYHYAGSSALFMNALHINGESEKIDHICIQFSGEDSEITNDLIVIAENEKEKNLINGLKYFSQEKDQLCVIILPFDNQPKVISTLASFRSTPTSKTKPNL